MLNGKRVILGITGGIAAYKISFLIRMLKKEGAEVKCILTPSAKDFVSPLTLSTLSGEPVYQNFWNREDGRWTNHVDLGMWADLLMIAPLTANTLSKMARGSADNLLLATYLSAKCSVIAAPAMDLDMYAHPTTAENLNRLEKHGIEIIPAEEGFLASGLEGKGRMAEPTTIFERIEAHFTYRDTLSHQKILITAGPTYESIDPVRYIGNFSSGKMGFALAEVALQRGAEVILVTGPTQCRLHHSRLKRIDVQSTREMYEAVHDHFGTCSGGIFAAAVSDYRPAHQAEQKIKKSDQNMSIELVKNPDILASIGESKSKEQWLMGFALETEKGEEHALKKLKKKNLNAIVLNTLQDAGAGFGHDTNKITVLDKDNISYKFELTSKRVVAQHVLNFITDRFV